jgi:hypothetical protein
MDGHQLVTSIICSRYGARVENLTAPMRGSGSSTGIRLIFRGLNFSRNADIGQISHFWTGTHQKATMTGILRKSAIQLLLILLVQGCAGPSLVSEASAVRRCMFTFEGAAQSVCISGDFNQWSPDSHCMRKRKGAWRINLMLPVGVYRYKLVIDGRVWVVDPKALYTESDGFGQINAIAIIE